jgi:oligoendopeptidase F
MTVTPAPAPATNFASAAQNLRAYALDQFNSAFEKVNIPPLIPPPADAEAKDKETAKAKAAELAKAQGQLAVAFTQIGDADKQAAQATGYASIVALMGTTATSAASICARIADLMGPVSSGTSTSDPVTQAAVNEIDALGRVLAALAALSPASLWQPPPPASAPAG